jgi:hypothetical protein
MKGRVDRIRELVPTPSSSDKPPAGLSLEFLRNLRLRCIESGSTAQRVSGLETCRGNEPRAGFPARGSFGPCSSAAAKSILHRVFSQIGISEQSNQCGKNSAKGRTEIKVEFQEWKSFS